MDNSTNNMSEKLVQYLDGDLTGSERDELEKLLATDKLIQEELENLKLAREAVRRYGLKQKVATIHQQVMNEWHTPPGKIRSIHPFIRYSIAIAASVLIIILGSTAYKYFSLSANQLFAENYRSYELSTVRDAGPGEKSPLEKAYREKKYQEVTTIAFDRPFTIKEDFLRAMSFAELGNNEKAIASYKNVFSKNKATGSDVFNDEAEYYLALVYLRNKEYDHTLTFMNKIHSDTGHLYHEKITNKLIRKINRLN